MDHVTDEDPLLSYQEIAERTGISVRTLRNYRAGNATRHPLPEADDLTFPDRPRWRASTIQRWQDSRPGQNWRAGRTGPASS